MFRELQQSFLPNIPILRPLLRWFDAVSDWLDGAAEEPPTYANGRVLAAGTFANEGAQRYGFDETIDHPVDGSYTLFLTTPVDDPDNYIVHASLGIMSITIDAVYTISAAFEGTDEILVRIRRCTDDAGTPLFEAVDFDFFITVTRLVPVSAAGLSPGVPG
jgi:hypothetical protein